MIKALNRLQTEETYLTVIKAIYCKSVLTSYYMGKFHSIPTVLVVKLECPLPSLLFKWGVKFYLELSNKRRK